jgi:hypothetical protein
LAHSLLGASAVRFTFPSIVLGAALCACPQPSKSLDLQPAPGGVRVTGAKRTAEPAVTLQLHSEEQALAPLTTRRLDFTAQAGVELSAQLPVAFSTRGVWARVSAPAQQLTIAGRKVPVDVQSLTYFPLAGRRLTFTPEREGVVMLEPVASVDTLGGGVELSTAAPQQREVTGTARLADLPQSGADDTFARLVSLEVSATTATQLVAGSCGPQDAPRSADALLEVAAGRPTHATVWVAPGALCFSASAPATVTVTELLRVRRFATASLRAVSPATVLDTEAGVAWEGRPDEGQELRVSFSLRGEVVAQHQLVSVRVGEGAQASVGACGARPSIVRGSGLVLVPGGAPVCVTPGAHHVALQLVAVVTDRSDAVTCAPARRVPALQCAATDLLGKLNCIPGLTAAPYTSQQPRPDAVMYALTLDQPVDHFHPDRASFRQRMLLTVRDEAAPLVLATTGYELFDYQSDLASNFPVNELEVEHRFYEESTPQPADYSLLTIMQSASDSHRIFEALGALFPAPWVSTGHSKGGMTALFHRRFFPCDVAGSAPYVTPLSHGKLDPRFGPWLADLGGPTYAACRGVLNDLERGVISRRADFAPLLRGGYSRIGTPTHALWAAMSGTSLWGAFQFGRQDDPRRGCPAYEALIGDPDFPSYVEQYSGYGEYYSDEALAQGQLDPYTYQTQNELGSPGGNRAHLAEFGPIPTLPDDGELAFNGGVALPTFEPRAMDDIQQWLSRHGERFVFIYGGFDPWSAAEVDVTGARDTLKVMVPGLHHGVGLQDLTGAERDRAFSLLERWLGVSRSKRKTREARGPATPLEYRDVMHRHRL